MPIDKCIGKVCYDNKVCNPTTGRCIKKKPIKPKSCEDVKCPDGKVCNSKTLRCNKQKNDRKRKRQLKIAMELTTNDKLYFYSKSRDVLPGKGANESISDISLYSDLSQIKDWRKILSNFHLCPFTYEGYKYNTIEHVFQAKKIELADKEKAYCFTLDSGHNIGQGDGEIARKHRKLVKLNDDLLRKWAQMRDKVMADAALEKYKICTEARNVLCATNSAQLWHIVSRSKPVRFHHLENIRQKLF